MLLLMMPWQVTLTLNSTQVNLFDRRRLKTDEVIDNDDETCWLMPFFDDQSEITRLEGCWQVAKFLISSFLLMRHYYQSFLYILRKKQQQKQTILDKT